MRWDYGGEQGDVLGLQDCRSEEASCGCVALSRGEEGGRQHFTPALGQGNAEGRVEFRQDVLEGLAGFH